MEQLSMPSRVVAIGVCLLAFVVGQWIVAKLFGRKGLKDSFDGLRNGETAESFESAGMLLGFVAIEIVLFLLLGVGIKVLLGL